MSGFGIFLLTAATFIVLLALIKLFSWLTLVQERGGFGALIRVGMGRAASVKRLHEATIVDYVQASADEQTNKTDRPDGRVSVAEQWMGRLEVDRTRAAVIELMVYSGWQVGEIRSLLKGDNAVIGHEVAAARQRLGLGDDPPRTFKVRDERGERDIPIEERAVLTK